MAAIGVWFSRILAGMFGSKVFMSGVLMVILSIVLYNLAVEMIEESMNFALVQINGESVSGYQNPSISGFAGWFLAQVKLPEAVAVIVSCTSIRFILRKIPFLKW